MIGNPEAIKEICQLILFSSTYKETSKVKQLSVNHNISNVLFPL